MSAAKDLFNKFRPGNKKRKLLPVKKVVTVDDYTLLDYVEPYMLGIIFTIIGVMILQTSGSGYIRSMTTGGTQFPFTFQGFMWFVLSIGVGSLFFKSARIGEKKESFEIDCFPSDPNMILGSKEIAKILLKLKIYNNSNMAVFPNTITKVLQKYQTNKSVEEASSMLNSQIQIIQQKSDTEFNGLRYYSWLLPSLGFMGTVYGISEAVAVVGGSTPDNPDLLKNVAVSLAVAFDTTLLALVQSSVLLFFMNKLESKEENLNVAIEERIVNEVINRLS